MKLDSPITTLPLIGPFYAKKLEKLNIETVNDLLHHAPHRYLDYRLITKIEKVQPGETVTIKGEITSIKNLYTKYSKRIQMATIKDDTKEIDAVWFNQPYIVRNLSKGSKIQLSGKVDFFSRKIALISPEYEIIKKGKKSIHTGRLVPIYPGTAGVSSKWLRSRISFAFPLAINEIKEYLPQKILKKYNFLGYKKALKEIHFPNNLKNTKIARKRLSFNELLMLQLKNAYRKTDWQKNEVLFKLDVNKKEVDAFIKSLPFKLTPSQKLSVEEILKDLQKNTPMNRLLEGDVGSGKTVVAAVATLVSFINGYQAVFMAPTQILAQQHFDTLKQVFSSYNVRLSLITSSGTKGGLGITDVFVGTHALIHKKVKLDQVSLVVIDEQHRFGVEQRAHLITSGGKKKKAPHVLTMTATPIPRTIALTAYGDLDLSTLNELPKGRQQITTWVVPPNKRDSAYSWIQEQILKDNIQAFVICPLIEESDKETMKQVKAATKEYEKLIKQFPKLKIGLLHGRQKVKEKEKVLKGFREGKINILVSTPVVEVGIDIPNATIMLIEAAERFGLAQLHQLRGRVGRGKKKSYCLLFTEFKSKNVKTRLSALQQKLSGFELAELDLKLRGPGELFGTKQHGFHELKIASWKDTKLIKLAKSVADDAFKNPKIYNKLLSKFKDKKVVLN